VKEAVANGRLTDRGEQGSITALKEVAVRHGASIDQVAVAAALGQPWADVVLSGAVTPAQLESNIGALDLSLTEQDWDQLGSVIENPRTYWDRRAALPWR
jgi:aryl-alcohol dehydrogenase-like predicted oxidoreductase